MSHGPVRAPRSGLRAVTMGGMGDQGTPGTPGGPGRPQRAEELTGAMSGRRALVVEDEPELARLVGSYLERDGFAVTIVHDGLEAVARARAVLGPTARVTLPGSRVLTALVKWSWKPAMS